jgi:hypothetical protein
MKSKQLANVLIKVIGLYICLCAIPQLLIGIVAPVVMLLGVIKLDDVMTEELLSAVGAVIQFVVGIFLFVKSRKLSGSWFKNEDE